MCTRQVILSAVFPREVCSLRAVRVECRHALLKFGRCALGTMLWPATQGHARAAHVLPSRSTACCSIMCGPRGVLVPSQAGGATCGVSRRAFLAGQDFVSARSSFVSRPPRSSCRKLPGVLTVRLDSGVETCLVLRSFPSQGIGECFTQRACDRLGQAHGRRGGAIRHRQERGHRTTCSRVHCTLGGSGEAGRRPVAGDAAPGQVRRAQAQRGGGEAGG